MKPKRFSIFITLMISCFIIVIPTYADGNPLAGEQLGDISRGNHPNAPYYVSDIIVPRPKASMYTAVPKALYTNQITDISGHWAEQEIRHFISQGYITGYPDGTFCPDEPVTYAEFVSIVARFQLQPVRFHGGFRSAKLFDSYDSWDDTKWYHTALMIATEAGIFGNPVKINQDQGNQYQQQMAYGFYTITDVAKRQYIALFLSNMLPDDENEYELYFIDQDSINPYSDGVVIDGVKKLVKNHIITGYPDNTFRPDASITRAELVAMLTKILNLYDMDEIHDNLYGNYYAYFWKQDEILIDLVNEARIEAGVERLEYHPDLQALAEIKNIDKTIHGYEAFDTLIIYDGKQTYMGHISDTYGSLKEMASIFGVLLTIGENASTHAVTAKDAQEGWTKSEAHRKNYLNERYKYIGVSIGDEVSYEMFGME